jgi:hypothetical protein
MAEEIYDFQCYERSEQSFQAISPYAVPLLAMITHAYIIFNNIRLNSSLSFAIAKEKYYKNGKK